MLKRFAFAAALLCAITPLLRGQVAVQPILQPHQHFVDSTGSPCTGCQLFSYSAGTTTPKATYTDSTGGPQNTNPIILDAAGGANIWVSASAYKFVLKDALGTTIWTVDNVSVSGGGGCGASPCTIAQGGTGQTTNITALNALEAFVPIVWCPTNDTVAQCVAMLPAGGGTVYLASASYRSGANTTCITASNINIVGAQEPIVSSDGSHLQGGSIILGGISFCGSNHSMSNLGVDVGSTFIAGGGALTDGIVGSPATYTSGTALMAGDTLTNVIELGPYGGGIHAIRTEHETGVNWTNVAIVGTGGHGFTIKSQNVIVDGYSAVGCVTDCAIVASDGNTAVTNVNLSNGSLATSTGGHGMVITSEGALTTSYVTVSNTAVNITGAAATTGFFISNDAGGNGAVNHITISDSPVTVSGGAHPCFLDGSTGGYSPDTITLNNEQCFNPTVAGSVVAIDFLAPSVTNLVINDFKAQCQTYTTQIEGTATIRGFADVCPSTYSQPSITSAAAGTVVNLYGYDSNRSNPPPVYSGSAIINLFPNLFAMNVITGTSGLDVQFNGNVAVAKNVTAQNNGTSSLVTAQNTGSGSATIQAISGNSFANTLVQTPTQAWQAGMQGDAKWRLQDLTTGTNAYPIEVSHGAPTFGLFLDTSGISSAYFTGGGCLQAAVTSGVITPTGSPCGSGGGGVADVNVSVGSFAIPANTCYGSTGSTTPATFAMTGVTTAMQISAGFTANPAAINGWGATGGLNIAVWPSAANTGSYVVCNSTSGSITGGAITFAMGAQ